MPVHDTNKKESKCWLEGEGENCSAALGNHYSTVQYSSVEVRNPCGLYELRHSVASWPALLHHYGRITSLKKLFTRSTQLSQNITPFHAFELVDREVGSGAQGFVGTWRLHVINGPLFGTAWRVLILWMAKTTCRYGWQLRVYWKISRGQLTAGGPPDWALNNGLTAHCKKCDRDPRTWTY